MTKAISPVPADLAANIATESAETIALLSGKLQRLVVEQPRNAAHIEHLIDVFLAMSTSEILTWLRWLDGENARVTTQRTVLHAPVGGVR